MLGAIARIGRRSDVPYVGVHLVVISSSGHYVYASKPSRIPVPGYYSRICIWIGGSSGPSK